MELVGNLFSMCLRVLMMLFFIVSECFEARCPALCFRCKIPSEYVVLCLCFGIHLPVSTLPLVTHLMEILLSCALPQFPTPQRPWTTQLHSIQSSPRRKNSSRTEIYTCSDVSRPKIGLHHEWWPATLSPSENFPPVQVATATGALNEDTLGSEGRLATPLRDFEATPSVPTRGTPVATLRGRCRTHSRA